MFPNIKPPQQKQKKKSILKYSNILEENFVSLIVGKPGSGKSYLITQLLTDANFYLEYFDLILLITPSGFENIKFEPNICNKKLDELWIRQKLQELNACKKPEQEKNVLIVLDDVVNELDKNVKYEEDIFIRT